MPPREQLRSRVGGLAIEGFLRGLSRVARLHPEARPARHDVEIIRDVPYGDGGEHHLLDVYRPRSTTRPMPVVLHVHGGGFRILSKDTHWLMGLAFARRGFLVFNINYRLAPKHPFPAAVRDVCLAYEWTVAHAAAWGGDVSRLVVAGESAGANLACVATIASCFERPEPWAREVFDTEVVPVATIPFCGLLQVSSPERYFHRPLPQIVKDRMEYITRAYLGDADAIDLADPLLILESETEPARPLPPFFAPVGSADPIAEDTRRLGAALNDRGVRAETPHYEREPHAFHAFVFREAARRCWRDTYAFLDEVVP